MLQRTRKSRPQRASRQIVVPSFYLTSCCRRRQLGPRTRRLHLPPRYSNRQGMIQNRTSTTPAAQQYSTINREHLTLLFPSPPRRPTQLEFRYRSGASPTPIWRRCTVFSESHPLPSLRFLEQLPQVSSQVA